METLENEFFDLFDQRVEDHYSLNRPIEKIRIEQEDNAGQKADQIQGKYLYIIDGLQTQFHISHYLVPKGNSPNIQYVPTDNSASENHQVKKSLKVQPSAQEIPLNQTNRPFSKTVSTFHSATSQNVGDKVNSLGVLDNYNCGVTQNDADVNDDDNDDPDPDDDDDDDDDADADADMFSNGCNIELGEFYSDKPSVDELTDINPIGEENSIRKEDVSKLTLVTKVTQIETFGLRTMLFRFLMIYPAVIFMGFVYIAIVDSIMQYVYNFFLPTIKDSNSSSGDILLLFMTVLAAPVLIYAFVWILSVSFGYAMDNWHEFEFLGTYNIFPIVLRQWLLIGFMFVLPMSVFLASYILEDVDVALENCFATIILGSLGFMVSYILLSLFVQIQLWGYEMGTFVPWKLLKRTLSVRFEGWVSNPRSLASRVFVCSKPTVDPEGKSCTDSGCCSMCICDNTFDPMDEDARAFENTKFGLNHRLYTYLCMGHLKNSFLNGVRRSRLVNMLFITIICLGLLWANLTYAVHMSSLDKTVLIVFAFGLGSYLLLFVGIRSYRAFKSLRDFQVRHSWDVQSNCELDTREAIVNTSNNARAISRRSPSMFLLLLITVLFLFLFLFLPIWGFVELHFQAWAISYVIYWFFSTLNWVFSPKALLKRPGSAGFRGLKSDFRRKRRLYLLINRIDRLSFLSTALFLVLSVTFFSAVIYTIGSSDNSVKDVPLQNTDQFINGTTLKYPICALANEPLSSSNITIVDLSYISAVSSFEMDKVQSSLDDYFGVGEMEVVNLTYTYNAYSHFISIYYPALNVQFISVRGPQGFIDIMQTFCLWLESALIQIVMGIFPYDDFWEFSYPIIINALYLGRRDNQETFVYEDIIAYVNAYKASSDLNETFIFTGHGLGGGMASLSGTETNDQSIVFGAPNSIFPYLKFDIDQDVYQTHVINLIPEDDVLSRVGGSSLLQQNIECLLNSRSLCHQLTGVMCALQQVCGSQGRPEFAGCTNANSKFDST